MCSVETCDRESCEKYFAQIFDLVKTDIYLLHFYLRVVHHFLVLTSYLLITVIRLVRHIILLSTYIPNQTLQTHHSVLHN